MTEIVCVDLDSTLADTRHRRERCPTIDPSSTWDYYAAACANDAPIRGTIAVVRLLHAAGYDIHIVTNRPHAVLHATVRWLDRHQVPWRELKMRLADSESHTDHKMDYTRALQAAGHTVALWIEDWPANAAALETLGVPVLCINPRYANLPVPAVR